MTREQFGQFWQATYPEAVPIAHSFKHIYKERWLRIHSLPESKRYAESATEWSTLLDRQNQLITDVFGAGSKFLLIAGEYSYKGEMTERLSDFDTFAHISFIFLKPIDLYAFDPEVYEKEQVLYPCFSEQVWQPHGFDDLLRNVAEDKVTIILVSIEKNCIIVPYDGGVDLIFKNIEIKEKYREKYQEWLSKREDGL